MQKSENGSVNKPSLYLPKNTVCCLIIEKINYSLKHLKLI